MKIEGLLRYLTWKENEWTIGQTVLPSKAIKNERILETLMFQANSGMYRIQESYIEACHEGIRKQDTQFSEWESFDCTL